MSETQIGRTTSKSKSLVALLVVEASTSEELSPQNPIVQSSLNGYWNKAFHGMMSLADYHVRPECGPPPFFDMSYDKYIEIFNNLTSARSYAFNYLKKGSPKSFKNSYIFKTSRVIVTVDIYKPKDKYQLLIIGINEFKIQGFESKSFSKEVV